MRREGESQVESVRIKRGKDGCYGNQEGQQKEEATQERAEEEEKIQAKQKKQRGKKKEANNIGGEFSNKGWIGSGQAYLFCATPVFRGTVTGSI